MSEVKLTAEQRSEFGKGAARRLRRADKVPAVLYGHGTDPVHVSLPGHATMLALKHSNTLLTLDLGGGQTALALPKDVQRHALKGWIEHVDLLLVKRGEKVQVDIPLHITGELAGEALLNTEMSTLAIEVEATRIPSAIEISIDGLAAGARIVAGEITLPAGATLVTDAEALVVHVSAQAQESQGEAASEEAVGEPVAVGADA